MCKRYSLRCDACHAVRSMRAHTVDACRFEGKDIGGRVQTFSYEGHVCTQSDEHSVSFCTYCVHHRTR